MNRRIRSRTYGGVRGREPKGSLLLDAEKHGREAFLQATAENILTTTVKDLAKCVLTLILLMNVFYNF